MVLAFMPISKESTKEVISQFKYPRKGQGQMLPVGKRGSYQSAVFLM